MPVLAVEIIRFVDESFPGFVECKLLDVNHEAHFFVEKAPVVSAENLSSASSYPRQGSLQCELLASWQEGSTSMVKVSTERPWGIASTMGETEFSVLASQLRP
jgi:hypothetical protein